MKFLVDAQFPVRLAMFLQKKGHDVLHTRNLPEQNATSDTKINQISLEEERVVVTKDSDFVDSFMTIGKPWKLLLITTGNIRNSELENIFDKNLTTIVAELQSHDYVEMNGNEIIVHQ